MKKHWSVTDVYAKALLKVVKNAIVSDVSITKSQKGIGVSLCSCSGAIKNNENM